MVEEAVAHGQDDDQPVSADGMSKQITLTAWAARHYDPPPALRTLRAWARAGRIQPAPTLVGREYRVDEDAEYVPAGAPLTPPPAEVDAVVAAIWNRPA